MCFGECKPSTNQHCKPKRTAIDVKRRTTESVIFDAHLMSPIGECLRAIGNPLCVCGQRLTMNESKQRNGCLAQAKRTYMLNERSQHRTNRRRLQRLIHLHRQTPIIPHRGSKAAHYVAQSIEKSFTHTKKKR